MSESKIGRQASPLWIRRPWLLLSGARVNRDKPPLEDLRALEPAERFVWGILPHAARSFAPCIIALPSRIALPAAVGYLYCRILDSYEDLVRDGSSRDRALRGLVGRLECIERGDDPGPAPGLSFHCDDRRDQAHALLAQHVSRLDTLYSGFEPPVREAVRDLVSDMSAGMLWASAVFESQGGSLSGSDQLSSYCHAVLGNPVRFAARLFQWADGRGITLAPAMEEASMEAGEFLQLANITRDLEGDLKAGRCYHPSLAPQALVCAITDVDAIRATRAALCDRALALAPAYQKLVSGMQLRPGLMTASALMMLRFTERHYRKTAMLAGAAESESSGGMWGTWPALIFGAWAKNQVDQAVKGLQGLRSEIPPQASSMYLS